MRVSLLLCALVVAACQGDRVAALREVVISHDLVDANATVRFVDIEGGCWVLETQSGRYEPINLAAQYRIDGLRVYVRFSQARDVASFCMLGPLVRIDEIRSH